MKGLLATIIFSFLMLGVSAQEVIDLSGQWQFMIDRDGVGESQSWFLPSWQYDDTIDLPASMPERLKGDRINTHTPWVGAIYDSSYYHNPYMSKYRVEGTMKLPFFLTPSRHYVGKAWYRRTVTIPGGGDLPMYRLVLERPHIISEVWVNGEKVPSAVNNSLSVPHQHYLYGYLHPGENTIVICIDNDYRKVGVGMDSHSVSDQTQGCWNGMVGKIQLQPFSQIESLQVYPDVDRRMANVRLSLSGLADGKIASIVVRAEAFNTSRHHSVSSETVRATLAKNSVTDVEVPLVMGSGMLLWDEFHPQLYRLTAEVTVDGRKYTQETVFGMRKIEIRGKMFYVNGRQIQLRGNVESCLFPNTGYPPTDLESWISLYRRCKEYGLNHIRFHSYCPPEAAFLAADIVGFYIQPEGPSWPNHGVKLGRGEIIDDYLYQESLAICDEYGNHPSFTFFAFGNEPAGNWVKWCNEHIPLMKAYDNRHIYAGFSVGGGWAWQPKSEFAVKAGARGLAEWVRRAPESMADFRDKISVYNGKDMPGTPITVPFVTHEMGQWCVFPNFRETVKYTGVNKAANFDIFRDLLRDNGMESRANDFFLASGKLQTLCYKYETERILRTPDYAGFQLLALNDYSGQGSALVGVTDVFYGEKEYCRPTEFREFCSSIVPLAKFPKFTYSNTETFEADIELCQFTGNEIAEATPHWSFGFTEGDLPTRTLPIGQNIALGKIKVPLGNIKVAGKYTLTVTIPGTEARNHWDIWVYPELPIEEKHKDGKRKGTFYVGDIYVTDSLDQQAQKLLDNGGKVLICAAGKVTYGREVVQQFLPVFWNTSWFKMRPPHTTGIFVEAEHPVFRLFPTDYHSDLQWWELVNKAQVMQFTDFPRDFQPLVQSIDTWFVSRKVGMLFEAKVGNGRLMMTTMDISHDLDRRLVARQMRASILSYMQGSDFNPQYDIPLPAVRDLFTKVNGEINMYTNESPDELKPKLIGK